MVPKVTHGTKRVNVTFSPALLIPMGFVIGVGYLDCNTVTLAVVFITLQEGFNSAFRSGAGVTRMDLAPRYLKVYI
jgi:hypothetical protein